MDAAARRIRQLAALASELSRLLPWIPPLWLVSRRIRERWALLVAMGAGLVTAVTLLATVPLYASAAGERLLHENLQQRAYQGNLAVAFRYTATRPGPLNPDRHRQLDALLRTNAQGWLGLPSLTVISAGESATQPVQVLRNGRFQSIYGAVTSGYLGYREGLFQHIELTDGHLPSARAKPDGEIEALISSEAADHLPVKVGDHVLLYDPSQTDQQTPPIKIQIVGAFRPRDPREMFWYGAPDTYQRRVGMFVDSDVFHGNVMTQNQPFGSNLSWYFLFPEKDVTSATADSVVGGIEFVAGQINQIYPQTMVDRSIYAAFENYDQLVSRLRLVLVVFAATVVAIVLYYVSLVTRLLVDSQGVEIAVLRSRGARDGQVVSLVTIDVVSIVIPALAIGLALGLLLARLVGAAYGFLLFAEGLSVPVRFSRTALEYGALGVGLALLSVMVAAAAASRHGIVARGRALGRALGMPWWQRYFVDFLLLGVSVYGYNRFRTTGAFLPGVTLGPGDSTFVDPLVLLLPIVFLATCGLLAARFLPLMLSILAWLAGLSPLFPLVMALRQLARAPGQYTGLVLLLVWTTGLGSFTAAVARTLDGRTVDDAYFQVGSDVRFTEEGWLNQDLQILEFAPIELALKSPGVLGATRVTFTELRQQLVPPASPIRVVGIDRVTFPGAAWFRRDFSSESLGDLMNSMAINPSGALVDQSFARAANLTVGSPLTLSTDQENVPISFVVVGILQYFPTLYPADGPFVITNDEYLQSWLGSLPQQLWFHVRPTLPAATLQANLQNQGFILSHADDARLLVKSQKLEPLRVGTFGLLSVGFLAGMLLIVLGFIMYSILAFRRRSAEFGLLRVLGLSGRQLGTILVIEHLVVVGAGTGSGSLAGTFAARLLTPFLLSTELGKHAGVPPVLPIAPWDDLLRVWELLAVVLFFAIPILVIALLRRQLAQTLRAGEATE